MKTNLGRTLMVVSLIIIGAVITVGILPDLMTDPTPPQVRAAWYLPQQDIVWSTQGLAVNQSSSERLIFSGGRDGPALQFPPLSPYARYENYTREKTGDRYIIATWYFIKEDDFLASKQILRDFLMSSGTMSGISLNYTGYSIGNQHNYAGDSYPVVHIPENLTTTAYEGNETTGLFFTVEIPTTGIPSGGMRNNEYYIVYYGAGKPAALSSSTSFLRDLIGQTYAYDRMHSAGPLLP
jgi:hypothetical protein